MRLRSVPRRRRGWLAIAPALLQLTPPATAQPAADAAQRDQAMINSLKAVLQSSGIEPDELGIGLVDKRSRLKRMFGSLALHVVGSQTPQLVIYQR